MCGVTDTRIPVIGPCAVASCRRPAARHLSLTVGTTVVGAGAVCEHCERATRAAAFFLELSAA